MMSTLNHLLERLVVQNIVICADVMGIACVKLGTTCMFNVPVQITNRMPYPIPNTTVSLSMYHDNSSPVQATLTHSFKNSSSNVFILHGTLQGTLSISIPQLPLCESNCEILVSFPSPGTGSPITLKHNVRISTVHMFSRSFSLLPTNPPIKKILDTSLISTYGNNTSLTAKLTAQFMRLFFKIPSAYGILSLSYLLQQDDINICIAVNEITSDGESALLISTINTTHLDINPLQLCQMHNTIWKELYSLEKDMNCKTPNI